MKNLVLLSLCGLFLVGCDPIDGTLQVMDSFSLTAVNNNCQPGRGQCNTSFKLPVLPGSHQAQIAFRSPRETLLNIRLGRQTHQVVFSVPSGKTIPQDNGSFILTPKESGQPVDLLAGIQTSQTDGLPLQEFETCRFRKYENVCTIVGDPPQTVCRWQEVEHIGSREVIYFWRTTLRDMQVTLNKPNTVDVLASMSGQSSESHKVYISADPCR